MIHSFVDAFETDKKPVIISRNALASGFRIRYEPDASAFRLMCYGRSKVDVVQFTAFRTVTLTK